MGKIRTFFNTLLNSVSSPAYYAHIIKAPFSFSLKFFYFYFFLFSVIATLIVAFKFILPAGPIISVLPTKIASLYPEELVITIQDGEASTNVQEPFFIPFSEAERLLDEFKNVLGAEANQIQNMVVIDTSASLEDFERYNTWSLLTKTTFSYVNDDGNLETMFLSQVENITITKQMVDTLVNVISPFIGYVVPVLIMLVFIGFFGGTTTMNLIRLLVFAILIWIVGRLFSIRLSYGKSYQVGLHSLILPTTIFSLLGIFDVEVSFPFRDAIIITLWAVLVLRASKPVLNQTAPIPPAPPQPHSVSQR